MKQQSKKEEKKSPVSPSPTKEVKQKVVHLPRK